MEQQPSTLDSTTEGAGDLPGTTLHLVSSPKVSKVSQVMKVKCMICLETLQLTIGMIIAQVPLCWLNNMSLFMNGYACAWPLKSFATKQKSYFFLGFVMCTSLSIFNLILFWSLIENTLVKTLALVRSSLADQRAEPSRQARESVYSKA